MIFIKPKNVTLTDMAQWIDANQINSEDDKNKQVEYLYQLVLVQAKQHALFTDNDLYDDFALFCVTKILVRFNNKQKQPVKSVVNYLRNVIHKWYAEYVRQYCCGCPEVESFESDISDFSDYLIDDSSENDYRSLLYDANNVITAFKQHLSKIPHKRNSSEWGNICISCLLTLQDRINSAILLTQNLKETNFSDSSSHIIRGLKNRSPILFHLDDSLSGYVSVLVNELVHVLAVELTHHTKTTISPSDCLKNFVIAAQQNEEE